MVRFLVRLAGLCALAGAVIALVVDGTKSVAASALILTPLGQAWFVASPDSLARLETAVTTHLGRFAWDGIAGAVLALPVWLVFGALGALLILAARPPRFRALA